VVGPAAKRQVAKTLTQQGVCSERRVCTVLDAHRSTVRSTRRVPSDEDILRKRIRELANKFIRYGYRRIANELRKEGWGVNVKRVHRLWKEEGFKVKRKPRKRRALGPSPEVAHKATHPNDVWCYDFIEDRTERGGKLRMLTVLDEFTRENHAIRVERSITSQQVIDTLQWLFMLHGTPKYIRSDNGPEFIATALRKWLSERGTKTVYIEPGRPWQNPYIESFHDKLRDECLNMELFTDGHQAQQVIEHWRREYNEQRSHSSLNYMTPADFANQYRNSSRPTASLRHGTGEDPGIEQQATENPLTLVGP
jgi:putative transposase|tara:strand:+ start:370 stop:1296 length:927 start_codon:yes stop_codon:yes gene_type:complete